MKKQHDNKSPPVGYINKEKLEGYLKNRADTRPEPIIKSMKITRDPRGQYLVRIPKKISDIMALTAKDEVSFHLKIPEIGTKDKPELIIELKRG